jgi:hypothetical protein
MLGDVQRRDADQRGRRHRVTPSFAAALEIFSRSGGILSAVQSTP